MGQKAISFLSNSSLSQAQKENEFRKLLKSNFDMATIARFALGRTVGAGDGSEENTDTITMEMEAVKIAELYEPLTLQEWAWLFAELSDDDVVAILELFPPEASEVLVNKLPEADQDDILELMTFPEESAGRFMTNEFLSMEECNMINLFTR